MPKYPNEMKELESIVTEVLHFSNPHGLSDEQKKHFRLVTNTLLYILVDENMAVLKQKPKTTFFPGNNETEQKEKYVPIHFENIRARAEHETKTESETQNLVEKLLIDTLVTPFISGFNNLKQTATEEEPFGKRIQVFCDKLSGHCIDNRIDSALNYSLSLEIESEFTELLHETLKSQTFTNYYDAFAEILQKIWNRPFKKDTALTGLCKKRGRLNAESFDLIRRFLTDYLMLEEKSSDFFNAYKKTQPLKRDVFLQFISHLPDDQAVLMNKDINTSLDFFIRRNDAGGMLICLQKGADLTLLNSENETPMEVVAKQEKWDCMEAILAHQPFDRDNRARYGTALFKTCNKNQKTLARKLIASGTNFNVSEQVSPLQAAIYWDSNEKKEEKDESLLDSFLKTNVDIHFMEKETSPLVYATNDFVSLATFQKLLEQKKININQRNSRGETALAKAANAGCFEKVKALTDRKEINPDDFKLAATCAFEKGHIEMGFFLLEKKGVKFNDPTHIAELAKEVYSNANNILHVIAQHYKPEYAKYLYLFEHEKECIEKENLSKQTPIEVAAVFKNFECVTQIAKRWPTLQKSGKYGAALARVCEAAPIIDNAVEALLEAKSELTWHVNISNLTLNLLTLSIKQNNIRIAKRLLQAGFNINTLSNEYSALGYAARSNEVTLDTFEWLLEQEGIDHTLAGKPGETPLFFATQSGNVSKIRSLKREMCDKATVNYAAEHGLFSAVEELVVDIDKSHYLRRHIFSDGNTFLHLAIQFKQPIEYILRLLNARHHESLLIENKENQTPLQLAAIKGLWEIVDLLLNYQDDESNPKKSAEFSDQNSEVILHAARLKKWKIINRLTMSPHKIKTIFYYDDDNIYSALHYAILANEEKMITTLLKVIPDWINKCWEKNQAPTPLSLAAHNSVSYETFLFLCEQKSLNPDQQSHDGTTALMTLAFQGGELALRKAKCLFDHGPVNTSIMKESKTALMCAAKNENIQFLNFLLTMDNSWKNPLPAYENNENLFHVVAKLPHAESVDTLKIMMSQEHKLDINSLNHDKKSPLFLAIESGQLDKANRILSSPGIKVSSHSCEMLSVSAIAREKSVEFSRALAIKAANEIIKDEKQIDWRLIHQAISDCQAHESKDSDTILQQCISDLTAREIEEAKKCALECHSIAIHLNHLEYAIQQRVPPVITESLLYQYSKSHLDTMLLLAIKKSNWELCQELFHYGATSLPQLVHSNQWENAKTLLIVPESKEPVDYISILQKANEMQKWDVIEKIAELKQHPLAEYYLGGLYLHGIGFKKNEKEAIKWFQQSAAQGNANAQYALASIYNRKKDYNSGYYWYRKAAEHNKKYANKLRQVYENNTGFMAGLFNMDYWDALVFNAGSLFVNRKSTEKLAKDFNKLAISKPHLFINFLSKEKSSEKINRILNKLGEREEAFIRRQLNSSISSPGIRKM